MKHNYCLNCNFPVNNKFCPSCGQKADTHPITFKHFLFHDVLHGVWHLEKGILFTLKEVIMRPGQAALDYVKGKRIRYYNVFYLTLLIIALDVVLLHYKHTLAPEIEAIPKAEDFGTLISRFSKIALFSLVPLLALNAKIVFKRLKLNFTEHLIIGGITLLGILLISILFFIFDLISYLNLPFNLGILEVIAFFLMPLFPVWSYYNATKNHYTSWEFSWRILAFYFLLIAELIVIVSFITVVFLEGKTEINMSL